MLVSAKWIHAGTASFILLKTQAFNRRMCEELVHSTAWISHENTAELHDAIDMKCLWKVDGGTADECRASLG